MDKNIISNAIKKIKENSGKRNFKQSYDLIINLKNLDLKQADHQLDFFVQLHFSKGKKIKVCGLVGPELQNEAKTVFDTVITQDEFAKYAKDKKAIKKLAQEHEFFVAQANIMPLVASSFGRVLGPRGKMPNPKAGCVVPPKTSLKPLYERLQKTLRISAKVEKIVQCAVGTEEMKDEEIIDNVINVYNNVIHHLPQEKNNVKSVLLKLTMGKPVLVGKVNVEKGKAPVKKEKIEETTTEDKEESKEEKSEGKKPVKEKGKNKEEAKEK